MKLWGKGGSEMGEPWSGGVRRQIWSNHSVYTYEILKWQKNVKVLILGWKLD